MPTNPTTTTRHGRCRPACALLLLVLVPGVSANAQNGSPAPAPRVTIDADPIAALKLRPAGAGEYVIGRGDVLEVSVWDNTTVSRTVPVRPDGRISLPLLNDVQAAGLTAMQLQEYLARSLGRYIENPVVSVIVREVHSYQVSVVGQVKTPGRFQLTDHATVLDALAMAGGLTEFADRGRITVLRRSGSGTRYIPFAYNRIVSRDGSNGSQDNFYLQGDDIILVP
jgi:polysaccharide export outer membrane protein